MGKKSKSKGKAPRGRAGQKEKTAQRGRGAGGGGGGLWAKDLGWSGGHSRGAWDNDDDDDDRIYRQSLTQFTPFAQAGPRTSIPVQSTGKLRHRTITFVSAGADNPIDSESQTAPEEATPTAEGGRHSDNAKEEEDKDQREAADIVIQSVTAVDTDLEISEDAMAHMHIQSSAEMTVPGTNVTSSEFDTADQGKETHSANASMPEDQLFVVDTKGDPSLGDEIEDDRKQPVVREPSPAPSNSSDEVVLFRGRNNPVVQNDPVNLDTSNPSASKGLPPIEQFLTLAQGRARKTPQLAYTLEMDAGWTPAPPGCWWKRQKGQPRPDLDPPTAERSVRDRAPAETKVRFAEPEAKDDGGAEDTIAELQADWKRVLREKKQAKQPSLEPDVIKLEASKSNRRGKRGRKRDNRQLRKPIDSDEENDSDGEAAYDDYMANLAAQIDATDGIGSEPHAFTAINAPHHTALSGPSLVVDGKEIGDDETLPEHLATYGSMDGSSSTSSGPIGQDLSEISDNASLNYSDLESSELEEELEYTERQQWEDEEDLRQRRMDAMTDEQIAHMFAKQQEFGIDSDTLIIDDGDYGRMSDGIEGVGDVDAARAGLADMTNSSFSRSAKKNGTRRSNQRGGNQYFPDASTLADAVDQYGENGFDIMDFDRPSLRPTKKGRKGKLPPELEALSDEDLKQNMHESWENDRGKKRVKKAEREELRAQGLLGSAGKKGKADLSQKYRDGMSTQHVYEELRAFMQNDEIANRPFPPMGKKARRELHEIAVALNLKSKSVGSGNNRFPVVYKTSLTFYSPERFDAALNAASRGWLSRPDGRAKSTKKLMKKARAGTGGGFDNAAVGLRHGEIVGAGAPEIGKDNFGHRLMSKMGWTEGMALGAQGEGRLMPVEQVMRSGKAGLG